MKNIESKLSFASKVKQKWNHLNLTLKAFLPLMLVLGLACLIGGFSTFPSELGFSAALKNVKPKLSKLERDLISENVAAFSNFSSKESLISDSFINDFTSTIRIKKSVLLQASTNLASSPITTLFGISLYTSKSFASTIKEYILFTNSRKDSFKNDVTSNLKTKHYKYLFFNNKQDNTFTLFDKNAINLASNLAISDIINKLNAIKKIMSNDYPTLGNLSNFTFDNQELQNYLSRDFILNFSYSFESRKLIDLGLLNTYNKVIKEKKAIDKQLSISLSFGLIGFFLIAIIFSYLVFLYRQVQIIKKKGQNETN